MTKLAVLNEGLKASARPAEELTIALPHGPKVNLLDLTLDTVHRLCQYGARQWVQDSIAGYAKELKEEGRPEDEIKTLLVKEQEDRWTAIVDGTVGTRASGPRVRGIEKVIRDVASEEIRNLMTKLNKKLPKGEEWQTMLAAYIAKNADKLRTEAERRMASSTLSDEDAEAIAKELGLAA